MKQEIDTTKSTHYRYDTVRKRASHDSELERRQSSDFQNLARNNNGNNNNDDDDDTMVAVSAKTKQYPRSLRSRYGSRCKINVKTLRNFLLFMVILASYVYYLMSEANLLNYPKEISFRSLKNMLPFMSPFEEGNWRCYLMHNPDLMGGLKWTKDDAELHYLLMGQKERRRSSCRKEQERVNILKAMEGDKEDPFKLKEKYCCYLNYHSNIGHVLTDNALDLFRCGSVVSFLGKEWQFDNSINKQFFQAGAVLDTKVLPREQCVDYYDKNQGKHPQTGRLKAYTKMTGGFETWYDARETSNRLREIQKELLGSCGLAPLQYKPDPAAAGGGGGNDEDPYELLENRKPARSVMIVRRHPMRKLLNADKLLEMCQQLNLNCRIFEPSKFFAKAPENDDYLCSALREFQRDDPIVVGVMGAEMTYALLSGLRLFLMSFNKNFHPGTGCRIGYDNSTVEGELQIEKGLICRGYAKGMDPFFQEFAFNYGAKITPIVSSEDPGSMEALKNSTKTQCIKHAYYCADRIADVEYVKTELQNLIDSGELLPKRGAVY